MKFLDIVHVVALSLLILVFASLIWYKKMGGHIVLIDAYHSPMDYSEMSYTFLIGVELILFGSLIRSFSGAKK